MNTSHKSPVTALQMALRKTPKAISLSGIFALALVALLVAPAAFAAGPDTWTGTSDASWTNVANWTAGAGGTAPPAAGDSLIFTSATGLGGTTLNNDITGSRSFLNLTFDSGSAAYTFTNSAITLTGNVTNNSTSLQTINFPIAATTARTFTTTAGGGDITLGGVFSGALGGITKQGNGTLTLSGATNTYTGPTAVSKDTLVRSDIGGSTASTATLTVGDTAGVANPAAIMKIVTGANVTNYSLSIGANATGPGAVFQSGGKLTLAQGGNTADFQIGTVSSTYGYYLLSGGTLLANEIGIQGSGATGGGGVMDILGGTFTDSGYLNIQRGSSSSSAFGYGLLNVSGATAPATVTAARIDMSWNNNNNTFAVLNVGGGANAANVTCTGTGTTGLQLFNQNYVSALSIVNLLANGVLTVPQIKQNGEGNNPTAQVNFNGGTLQTTAGTTAGSTFFAAGNPVNVQVYPNGGTVNNNGVNITIAQPILAPTGNGVTGVTLNNQGAGYIGAPFVRFTGGTPAGNAGSRIGNVASAVAIMADDGTGNGTYKVNSVQITSPGSYSVDPTGVSFIGGSPTTNTTITSISTAANTSGGMTFTGAGATILGGTNNYTGGTFITGGTVILTNSGTLGAAGNALTMSGVLLNLGGLTPPAAGAVTITSGAISNGTLTANTSYTVNNSGSVSISTALAGSVPLAKTNTGTLRLSGINTYTGATTVSNGTLLVNGSLSASSTVSVSGSGTILGGNGTIGGNTTINGSASLAPGDSGTGNGSGAAGTNTFSGNLALASETSLFDLTIPASSGNDRVVVGGNLTLDNTDTIQINQLVGALDAATDYKLFSVTGTTTMSTTPALTGVDTSKYQILQSGNNVVLHYYGPPMPTVGPATFSPLSTVGAGQPVTVSAVVLGGTPPYINYDWQVSTDGGATFSDVVSGNGNPTYNLDTTGQAGTAYKYRLIVTDNIGATNAGPAGTLTVITPVVPSVASDTTITPPVVMMGSNATMSATFNATTPVYYQWQVTNGSGGLVNILGANNTTYTITNANYNNSGAYRLVASNYFGVAYSTYSNLLVRPPVIISDFGAADPVPVSGDIYQLLTNNILVASANGVGYYDDNNTPAQTFTTGSNPDGYAPVAFYVKYSGRDQSGNKPATTRYTLKIYSISGTTATLLSDYPSDNLMALNVTSGGRWVKYSGITNVFQPSTVYAYSHRANSGWAQMGWASNSPSYYAGGELCSIPTIGAIGGTATITTGGSHNLDGTFMIGLVTNGYPAVQDVSMSVTNGSTVFNGTLVKLNVTAIGTAIGYIWQIDNGSGFTDLPNSNTNIYSLDTTSLLAGSKQLRVLVTNSLATATSSALSLTVVPAIFQSIAISPTSTSTNPIYAPMPVTLSATVTNLGQLTYIWQTDSGSGGASFSDLPGSVTNTYAVDTTGMGPITTQYRLMVTNNSGSVASPVVTLYLLAASAPVVTTNTIITPSGVYVGGSTQMRAAFTGSPTITYQWMFDNGGGAVAIAGATNTTYAIANAQLTNSGAYYLTAANGIAPYTTSSSPANFIVAVPAPTNTTLCVIADVGSTPPPPGTNDISQFTSWAPTTIPVLNYYVDQSAPGQTFTTSNSPPTPDGYPLTSVYVQEEQSTASGGINTTPQTYTLGIYKVTGGNAVLITSYTTVNTLTFNQGDWIQFSGLTNILQTDTKYAFSVHRNGSGYWKLANDEDNIFGTSDLYAGGDAVSLPASGVGGVVTSSEAGIDAAFLVRLTPSTVPVVLQDTKITPSVSVAGSNVVMSAFFDGAAPLSYQWFFTDTNGVATNAIPGATSTFYNITGTHLTNSGSYSLMAWNSLGTNTSTRSNLTVVPLFVAQDTTIVPNPAYNGQGPVTISATINGVNASYQWQHEGTNILGATNRTYSISVAHYANAGSYSLVASNTVEGVPSVLASTPAALTVLTPPATLVMNFSHPAYGGAGVIDGGTYWNRINVNGGSATVNGVTVTIKKNNSMLLGDGGTFMGIQFSTFQTWEFGGGGGDIPLLNNWMLLQGTPGTSLFPITFSNCIPGVYNVVLYSANGVYHGARTVFTFNGESKTNINNSVSDTSFVEGANYAVFYNILVTNGVLTGYWSRPDAGEAAFNGAQLQMAYPIEIPHLFIAKQPVSVTNAVNFPVSISVLAEGPGPLFYQWFDISNVPVSGATNSTYAPSTSIPFTNSYYVVVTNLAGMITNSTAATICVYMPDTLSWRGANSTTWDTSALNWSNTVSQVDNVAYQNMNYVLFDDTATNFTVNKTMALTPISVTVNATNNYVFGGSGTLGGAMTLTKTGNGTLTMTSSYNTYTNGTIVNGGTLALAAGGGSGSIRGTLTINPGGTVNLTAGDALGYNPGVCVSALNIIGGTLTNSSGNEGYRTTFNLTGGTMSSGGGSYHVYPAGGGAINSLATNIGSTIAANIHLRGDGLVIATAQGTVPSGIDLSISGVISPDGGNTLTKTGNGTLSLSGVNTYGGDTTISAGTLRIDGAGQLGNGNYAGNIADEGAFNYNSSAAQTLSGVISGAGNLTKNGNGTLTLNGLNAYIGATTVNAGILAGNGAIGSAVTVNSGGTLSPGAGGIGTLTINNNLVLNAGSTNIFEVNGSTLAKDVIAVSGSVTYGGVLKVVPSGTFSAGQNFTLFTASGHSGSFTSIDGSPGAGMHYSFANGVLSVLSSIATNPTNITFSVSGGTLTLSWPSDHTGWILQSQTNSIGAGLSSNWVDVGGANTTNQITFQINPANGTVFFRLVYP